MKNKEKYIDKLMKVACAWHSSFGVDKDTGMVGVCSGITCSSCKFDDDDRECERCRLEWLEQEYIEHLVISKRDRDFLGYLLEDYKWMARDENEALYVYSAVPIRSESNYFWRTGGAGTACTISKLDIEFPMVKWSDEKPWRIADLLNLEVVDEY